MNRPIIVILVSYILGILGGLYISYIAFFFCILLVILVLIKKFNNKYFRFARTFFKNSTYILIITSIICGYAYIKFMENNYNSLYHDDELIKEQCIVVDKKKDAQYKDVYKVKVVGNKNNRKGTYLYINIGKNNSIEYGDLIYISGKYMTPDRDRNKKGFNYRNYLKTIKVYGIVNVEEHKILEREKINKIYLFSKKLKDKLKLNIDKVIKDRENQSILIGMVLGDTEGLSSEIEEDFLDSNLYHILSVSGGQVSNILIGIGLLTKIGRINKKVKSNICIIILGEFMILTGLTPSIIRACVMCIISLIAKNIIKRYDIANSFGISLLIILIDNPYAINSLSVLLSYFGFSGIIIIGSFFIKKINKKIKNNIIRYILNIVISSISAQIFISPIILYVFGTVSLTFIFSNLLIIPLSTVISVLGFFLMLCPIQIFSFVEILLDISKYVVKFFADINLSKIYFTTPSISEICIYYILITYMYYLIKREYLYKIKHFIFKYRRKLVSSIILYLIILLIVQIIPKDFKINFIDVGQGDCTLVTTKWNKHILIDGGGSEGDSDFDVGDKVVLPYLLKNKILSLDYIIISHFDSDHIGGIFTILESIKVNEIVIGRQFENSKNYEKFIEVVKNKKIKVNIVEIGTVIRIDEDTYINVLWPDEENKVIENSVNNNSLVFTLNYQNISVLFTGDIEEIAEKRILNICNKELKADILKVAHHGSKTSSCINILNAIDPKIALIGVGANNKFGHPSDDTINNLNKIKCSIYRTDEHGEIEIILKEKRKISINTHF